MEYKKCPFCGSEAIVYKTEGGGIGVGCRNHGYNESTDCPIANIVMEDFEWENRGDVK